MQRIDGRATDQLRPISLEYDVLGYSNASVLLSIGQTKVLASVYLQIGVPSFLRGQQTGWLTAEYAMLPCSTHKRSDRESTQQQRNARSVEISRLIGRCLRSIVDLDQLGEKTIIVDCDVLQADGGTRVACITAASLALNLAVQRWVGASILDTPIIKDSIAAISVGNINGISYLDLSCQEDNETDADFNFVLTQSGKLIEIQGTAEKTPLAWEHFDVFKALAVKGVQDIFDSCAHFPVPTNFHPITLLYQNKQAQPSHQVKQNQAQVKKNNQVPSQPQHQVLDNRVQDNFDTKVAPFSLGKRIGKF